MRAINKSLVIGLSLFLLGSAVMVFALLRLSQEEFAPPFFFGWILWFSGIGIWIVGAVAGNRGEVRILSRVPRSIDESFQEIKPEKIFKTRTFTVLKKKDIYILIPKLLKAVYFVKLFDQSQVQEKAVKLPIMFPGNTQFKDEVEGLPVAKSRGEIIIPVDVSKHVARYVRGTGVSYLVPTSNVQYGKPAVSSNSRVEFNRSAILRIIEILSEETD